MTDIESLQAYGGQIAEAAESATTSAKKQHEYVNGDASTDVLTESGPVPSLAKQAVQGQAKVTAALVEVASQMAGAMTYDTTAIGLLHTVDGGYFSVPSPESTEYLILYQNNAGAALEKDRYPNSKAVGSARLTSGDVFNSITTFGQAINGGVLILGKDGRTVGLSIPAGQTGNTSYIRAQLGLQNQIANLVGAKIQIDMYLEATPNFIAQTVMTSTVMQVLRSGSVFPVTPDTQSLSQTGDIIHKQVTYTIQPGDSDVYPVFRPGISTASADRSATMKSVIYAVISQPAGYASLSDYHLQLRLQPISAGLSANTLTSGERMDGNLFAWSGEALGGAGKVLDQKGNMIGLSVPSGASGAASYLSPFFKIDGAKLAGATISVTAIFNATEGFTVDCPPGGVSIQVRRGAGSVNAAPLNLRISQSGSVITKTYDYVITSDDLAIAPTYQIASSSPAISRIRSIAIASIKFTLSNLPGGMTSADAMLESQVSAAVGKVAARGPERDVIVSEAGGDYTTLAAANAASASASLASPVTVIMSRNEGTANVSLNDYVSVRGNGPERVWLHHEMPDNVTPTDIPGQQTLYVLRNNTLKSLKITAKNIRYPVHCESGGTFKNGKIEVIDCDIEHLGNQGAQDYQNSISSGITVWSSEHAWGYGASSGQELLISRSRLKSRTSAFYVHTNKAFDKPLSMRVEYSDLLATNDGGKAVYVQPLGSGQKDTLTLIGNQLEGDIYYWVNPWLPNTLDYQPANHCEVAILGSGNSPAVFDILEWGRALKIESALDGEVSSVVVGGNAVPVIFGKEVSSRAGCVGIPGHVYGWADISGTAVGSPSVGNITSLGKRLGDCSAVNKTLTVAVNGESPLTITFDLNYTGLSNETILAAINSVLGSAAVASSYNVGGRYRPVFRDEELSLKNNSASGILMGAALAYDGHHKKVRKMTSADDASLFAGIAWEDIYPGEFGRVKTRGYALASHLLGAPRALTFGQRLYVDQAEPGKLTAVAGDNPIMRAIRPDAVEVAKK